MFASTSSIKADHLAKLALSAATELDRLEHGNPNANITAINEFLETIGDFSGVNQDFGTSLLALDPSVSGMLTAAVSPLAKRPMPDVNALNEELSDLIAQWNSDLNKDGDDLLASLKTLCLNLHDYVTEMKDLTAANDRGIYEHERAFFG